MGNKKKTITKRTLKVKTVLTVCLLVIMIPLLLGWLFTKDKRHDTGLNLKPTQQTSAETTTADESTTIPETTAVSVTEAATAAPAPSKKKALVYAPTDADNWFLAIISPSHMLPDNYAPTLSPAISGSTVELDSRVSPHYQEMYNAAKADGCVLTPYSGYHSYSLQDSTYSRKVNYYISQGLAADAAEAEAKKKVFPAGASEHNAGLAMDIVSASSDFVNTKEYQWLVANAYKYGFIERYPESKAAITGITSEPWHWRYVGAAAAKEIHESGECLEEYLGLA